MRIITSDELGALKLFDLTLGDDNNTHTHTTTATDNSNNNNNNNESIENVIGKVKGTGKNIKTMDSKPICPQDLSMSRGERYRREREKGEDRDRTTNTLRRRSGRLETKLRKKQTQLLTPTRPHPPR